MIKYYENEISLILRFYHLLYKKNNHLFYDSNLP